MSDRGFVPRLRRLQPAAVSEALRQSLVAIPASCLAIGVILSEIVTRLDGNGVGDALPTAWQTSADNGRAVLGAIAGGTITVVTLVLTLTLVAIQLAAGQLSPRTIANFLGDRFQQATVGIVLGTAGYSLLTLRAVEVPSGDETFPTPTVTVLVAVILTGVSLLMLVLSVDRTASRLAVGNLLTDLAAETTSLVDTKFGRADSDADQVDDAAAEDPGAFLPGHAEASPTTVATCTVAADRAGWIQFIDEDALIAALPDGTSVSLHQSVGTFVFDEMPLLVVEIDDLSDQMATELRSTIVVGDQRTMQQDISYGLTRLNDIALRALSPGVNDPNTAREAILRLTQIVLRIQGHEMPSATRNGPGGRSLRRLDPPTHDAFAEAAFDQIRRAAYGDAAVLKTLDRSLQTLIDETDRRSLPGSTDEIDRQRKLVVRAQEALDLTGRPPV